MKTQDNATPVPQVFNQAPCVVSSGNDFYVIYGLGNGTKNMVAGTIYDGEWRNATLNYGSRFPTLMANGKIKAQLVNSAIYFVYQVNASQLAVVIINNSDSMNYQTSYTTTGTIGDFCLYTDNTYLYLVTNEQGLLFINRLNNTSFDQKIQINSTGGVFPNAPLATTTSPISAQVQLNTGLIHCVYLASTGLIDAFQLSTTQWSYTLVVDGATNYKSFQLYTNNQSEFMLAMCTSSGGIDVLKFQPTSPYWVDSYMSQSNVPASATAAQVGVNQNGTFISYVDTQGGIQCVYHIPNYGWNNIQIGGAGAGSGFVPTAPPALSAPGVGVYNNLVYHVCYVSTNYQVYDVFWGFQWLGAELYPTLLDTKLNLSNLEKKSMTMMP